MFLIDPKYLYFSLYDFNTKLLKLLKVCQCVNFMHQTQHIHCLQKLYDSVAFLVIYSVFNMIQYTITIHCRWFCAVYSVIIASHDLHNCAVNVFTVATPAYHHISLSHFWATLGQQNLSRPSFSRPLSTVHYPVFSYHSSMNKLCWPGSRVFSNKVFIHPAEPGVPCFLTLVKSVIREY